MLEAGAAMISRSLVSAADFDDCIDSLVRIALWSLNNGRSGRGGGSFIRRRIDCEKLRDEWDFFTVAMHGNSDEGKYWLEVETT